MGENLPESKLKTAHSGVFVDVGEHERFFISCSSSATYAPVHESVSSIVFRVTFDSGRSECMVVKWCRRTVYTPGRSFAASDLADGVVPAPRHHGVSVNFFYNSVVEIIFREFIEGRTAAECWPDLSPHSLQMILCQVSEIAGKIHNIK
ncbi:hypothetical protein ColTof4_14384 [Colletotrichum tofieldiae]|nr:hypothetical protein ColTof3_14797 [Colletotrichum tofieldiae]GKT81961.1 hypothetical protein ColTof4_14384 [Colletotrichum tofieldiae]